MHGFCSLLFGLGVAVTATHIPAHPFLHNRDSSPENICGPNNGFSCDASSPNGGPCCSQAGYCGSTDEYCGNGCQSGYGTCGSLVQYGGLSSTSTSSQVPAATTAAPAGASAGIGSPSNPGKCSSVSGAGNFASHTVWDFASLKAVPTGLVAMDEDVGANGAPFSRTSVSKLATVSDGYLNLEVPGGQTSAPIQCASVQTQEGDIKYASVRTTAIFSAEPGVCHGFFLFAEDGHELDIEYLTDPTSVSNSATYRDFPGNGSQPLWFTNWENPETNVHTSAANPDDRTQKAHVYRLDWTSQGTFYYVDDELVAQQQAYAEGSAGPWLWNNWANGDKGWSAGPPAKAAILRISKIEMFYSTSTSKC